jgi:cell division septum initiation protein DivIVA
MATPIQKFTGTSGDGKFNEFLKALHDEKYDVDQRKIALQLAALDPEDLEFDDSINDQSENIKENLQEYLLSIKRLQEKAKELDIIKSTARDICRSDQDNCYDALLEEDETERAEALELLSKGPLRDVVLHKIGTMKGYRRMISRLHSDKQALTAENEDLKEAIDHGIKAGEEDDAKIEKLQGENQALERRIQELAAPAPGEPRLEIKSLVPAASAPPLRVEPRLEVKPLLPAASAPLLRAEPRLEVKPLLPAAPVVSAAASTSASVPAPHSERREVKTPPPHPAAAFVVGVPGKKAGEQSPDKRMFMLYAQKLEAERAQKARKLEIERERQARTLEEQRQARIVQDQLAKSNALLKQQGW